MRSRGRSCDGKVKYTKREARATAAQMRRRYLARVSAYDCPYCNAWHVGHTPRKARH